MQVEWTKAANSNLVCDHVTLNQFEFTTLVHLNSSNWTKPAYSKKINQVVKNFEEKVNGPNLFRHAYAVT